MRPRQSCYLSTLAAGARIRSRPRRRGRVFCLSGKSLYYGALFSRDSAFEQALRHRLVNPHAHGPQAQLALHRLPDFLQHPLRRTAVRVGESES
jgi:hypothetical protein